MNELLQVAASPWPTIGIALLVFGFAPGFVLRLILLLYPRGDDRRRELLAELYAMPRVWRPMWVAQQLETGLFEGPSARRRARRSRRRTSTAVFYVDETAPSDESLEDQPRVDVEQGERAPGENSRGSHTFAGEGFIGRSPHALVGRSAADRGLVSTRVQGNSDLRLIWQRDETPNEVRLVSVQRRRR